MKLFELFNNNIITEWKREHLVHVFNKDKFKSWFGNSVVTKDGLPMPCYHYTPVLFNTNDFKPFSHFGTWQAAMSIWQYNHGFGGVAGRPLNKNLDKMMNYPNSGYWIKSSFDNVTGKIIDNPATHQTIPVFLKIKNPLRIIDHGQQHTLLDYLIILLHKKIIDNDTYDKLQPNNNNTTEETTHGIVKAMLDAGYDGFVYRNAEEHKRSTSYIILLPSQVKSVFEFFD